MHVQTPQRKKKRPSACSVDNGKFRACHYLHHDKLSSLKRVEFWCEYNQYLDENGSVCWDADWGESWLVYRSYNIAMLKQSTSSLLARSSLIYVQNPNAWRMYLLYIGTLYISPFFSVTAKTIFQLAVVCCDHQTDSELSVVALGLRTSWDLRVASSVGLLISVWRVSKHLLTNSL